jgi:hypothetical protein
MIFIIVDFPAPLGPNNPTISPEFTVNVTPSRALCFPNIFVTDSARTDISTNFSTNLIQNKE